MQTATTVKHGATTIHEDSAAYEVSISSLTMETEAVTHALRWIASRGDSQTTHVIILTELMSLLQKVKNGIGSPDWHVVRVVPTWDVGQVLRFLSQWHPASGITLHELTWKEVFLLAICTAKRVSDLLLFSVHSLLCHVGDTTIVLQTVFCS